MSYDLNSYAFNIWSPRNCMKLSMLSEILIAIRFLYFISVILIIWSGPYETVHMIGSIWYGPYELVHKMLFILYDSYHSNHILKSYWDLHDRTIWIIRRYDNGPCESFKYSRCPLTYLFDFLNQYCISIFIYII